MVKSIKSAAKEAKQRLKNRFWEDYKKEVDSGVKTAQEEGISTSGVKKYFRNLNVFDYDNSKLQLATKNSIIKNLSNKKTTAFAVVFLYH